MDFICIQGVPGRHECQKVWITDVDVVISPANVYRQRILHRPPFPKFPLI
jgi:hypothetical protein